MPGMKTIRYHVHEGALPCPTRDCVAPVALPRPVECPSSNHKATCNGREVATVALNHGIEHTHLKKADLVGVAA